MYKKVNKSHQLKERVGGTLLKIGFVGAGNVGIAMGKYLITQGLDVTGYYSRSKESSEKAAFLTKSKDYTGIMELVKDSEMIAITTSDDAIQQVSENLLKLGLNWHNKIIFHMSGVHASSLFEPLRGLGATIFSIHPMLSINDPNKAERELKTSYFTIEGKGERFQEIKETIAKWGNPLIEIDTKDKVLYHTAASIVSNYLVTLLDIGLQMLKEIGFDEKTALGLIQPLITKTMNNVIQDGTEKALTGPIARGDIGTVHKHIDTLKKSNQEWLDIYKSLGKETIDLAYRAGKLNVEMVKKMKGEIEDE